MGNKNTEKVKRWRTNKRLRKQWEAQNPKPEPVEYADVPTENEMLHMEAWDDQGFADFLDCGDH